MSHHFFFCLGLVLKFEMKFDGINGRIPCIRDVMQTLRNNTRDTLLRKLKKSSDLLPKFKLEPRF